MEITWFVVCFEFQPISSLFTHDQVVNQLSSLFLLTDSKGIQISKKRNLGLLEN